VKWFLSFLFPVDIRSRSRFVAPELGFAMGVLYWYKLSAHLVGFGA